MDELSERPHPIDPRQGLDLDCEAHRIALSSALDGEIDPVSFGETLGHLAICSGCQRFVADARALDATLMARSLAADPVEPKPVSPAIWKRIAAEAWPGAAGAGAASRPARAAQRWGWGLAAALLVTLAGLGLWNSVAGGGIAQEAMTEEGSVASEFARRGGTADAEPNRVVNDSGRQLGGNSR